MKKATTPQLAYLPPHDAEIEAKVICTMVVLNSTIDDVLERIKSEEVFYVDEHRKIFKSILNLVKRGYLIDLLSLKTQLESDGELENIGGMYNLTQIVTSSVASERSIETYCMILLEKYFTRQTILITGDVHETAKTESEGIFDIIEKATSRLFAITEGITESELKNVSLPSKEILREISKQRIDGIAFTGITTGFPVIDKFMKGWGKSTLNIIAARPGTGKTAFTLNVAYSAMKAGFTTLFFSLEMGKKELLKRMAAMVSGVKLGTLNSPVLISDSEMKRLEDGLIYISKLPLYVDDRAGLSIESIRRTAKKGVMKFGVGLIIVDYLQLASANLGKNSNREQEIATISRTLKHIAKELNVPVIALSQTNNRESDKKPGLGSLRESGAIEQDADTVSFLYKPLNPDEQFGQLGENIVFDIQKNRNGKTGECLIEFEKDYQRFVMPEPVYNQYQSNPF